MRPPLLFLHGFHGNHLGLKDIAKFLPEYRTFLPDLPPASNLTLQKYDPAHYARFVKQYIRDHNLKKPILIGHSMGSIIAAAVAERYPNLIHEKLFLLAPISKKPPRPIANLAPLTSLVPSKFVGFVSTKYLIVDKTHYSRILNQTYASAANQSSHRDVFRSARFSSKYAIPDFNFKQQTYIIAGEQDRLISQSATKSLAKKLGTNPIFIKDAGHLINYEAPEQVATIIKQFLKD